jgi:hypothetical protein
MRMFPCFVFLSAVLFCAVADEEITVSGGQTFRGTVISENDNTLRLKSGESELQILKSGIISRKPVEASANGTVSVSPDANAPQEAVSLSSNECVPPCRTGYFCKDGNCVEACNPPCPANYRCDGQTHECLPLSGSSQNQEIPEVQHTVTGTTYQKSRECPGNSILVGEDCEERDRVKSAGNVMIVFSSIFYGFGTLFSSIGPLVVASNNYTSASPYGGHGYFDDDYVYGITGGGMGAVFLFGLLDKFPTLKQARYLRGINADRSTGLIVTEWLLWGASLATTGLTMASFSSNSQDNVYPVASLNAAVTLAAYVVNIACYASQHRRLRTAVDKLAPSKRADFDGARLHMAPYLGFTGKNVSAGLAAGF